MNRSYQPTPGAPGDARSRSSGPEPASRIHPSLSTVDLILPREAGGAAALGDDRILVVGPEPERPTGLYLAEQEGGSSILTGFGYAGHEPPSDAAGEVGRARTTSAQAQREVTRTDGIHLTPYRVETYSVAR